ncbi:MAG: prepilin-type N-terminal cleavage/methylation domain-containing protein [Thermodesulfobacteriota bacterium]|jgi:prepilin-type N-terminal cleavage/methylation domain-containing protein
MALIEKKFILSALFSGCGPFWTIQLKNYFFHNTLWKRDINNKGFTLIEALISVVILSIAVTGIFLIFSAGLAPRKAPISIEHTTGAQLVQERLELIKADCNNPARGFVYIASANYPSETLTGAFAGYTRTTTISPSWGGDLNYTQVTVAVTHNGFTVARATTLVAKY